MFRTDANYEYYSKGKKALDEIKDSITEEQANAIKNALDLASTLTTDNKYTSADIRGAGEIIGYHLENFSNGVSKDECRSLVRFIIFRTHRYLQSEIFFRIIAPLIKSYSVLTCNQFDPRNENVVRICKEIVANTESFRYTENFVNEIE